MFKTLIFIQMLSFALAQYTNLKPDMGFGEHNDRFDISNLIKTQNNYYDKVERMKYRRNFGEMIDAVDPEFGRTTQKLTGKNFIKGDNILSRLLKVFSDDMRRVDDESDQRNDEVSKSLEDNIVEEAVAKIKVAEELRRRHLQRYVDKLHGIHSQDFQSRKKGAVDPEEEILMHHAVPFNFKVNGYLTAP